MTDYTFQCPDCSQSLETPNDLMGEVIECPSCKASIQLPSSAASLPTAPREPRIGKPGIILTIVSVFIVSMIALALVFRSPKPAALPPPANLIPEPAVSPPSTVPRAETSWELMSKAEAEMRHGNLSAVADTLNRIVRDYPQSHEAQIILGLVRLARQEGATPYVGSVSSCTLADVRSVKKSFDSIEIIAKQYHSASNEKKRAIDQIFGPGTFSSPNLSLDGLLNSLWQMEAARQKALRGE